MAYDEGQAARVRAAIDAEDAAHEEIKMFGGLAFMVNTHMAVGLTDSDLMLRTGKEGYDDALARGAVPMQMGERVMAGMVRVPGEQVVTDEALRGWVGPAVADALARPPKPPKKPKSRA